MGPVRSTPPASRQMPTRLSRTGRARRAPYPALAGAAALAAVAGLAAGRAACRDSATAPHASGAAGAAFDRTKAPAASCDAAPVPSLTVTPTRLTLVAGQTATFQACTQYASAYPATSQDATAATVAATGSAARSAAGQPLTRTFTVTAGASAGMATITVADKNGNEQTVAVNVVMPPPPMTYTSTSTSTGQTTPYAYTVPVSGTDAVGAAGARGGNGATGGTGGIGAQLGGDFQLKTGDVLRVIDATPTGWKSPRSSCKTSATVVVSCELS